jgi:rhodanese-related sulfurtransferase
VSREALHEQLAGSSPPVLVEALGAAYFADAHLPGALNLPADQVDRLAPELLPDLDADLVVYCSGTCSSATIAAERLTALGYRKVRIFEGGKEEWVEHGLPVDRTVDTTD